MLSIAYTNHKVNRLAQYRAVVEIKREITNVFVKSALLFWLSSSTSQANLRATPLKPDFVSLYFSANVLNQSWEEPFV